MDINEFKQLRDEFKKPVDFKTLVDNGALIQKGQSYYIGKMNLIPEYVTKKIKSLEKNRYGLKVTFYK
ncbi:hypothetical protein [Pseudomonas sp. TTU2014-080ASC]|uniref:hypothetical protein n=1 Tax=Pseudomonas sp. TTU2014-080ASC TaxID=1729724 RepID=UPI0007186997|nr:hypothetical protein [Pseudomonas sp. TTU2014-080ASC]KRW59404.1 hypothetical protein AO726_11335 [Pseudomonas sp. TTU2014-080ASC]